GPLRSARGEPRTTPGAQGAARHLRRQAARRAPRHLPKQRATLRQRSSRNARGGRGPHPLPRPRHRLPNRHLQRVRGTPLVRTPTPPTRRQEPQANPPRPQELEAGLPWRPEGRGARSSVDRDAGHLTLYRTTDPSYPFIWESDKQPPARWHGKGEGPAHYFATTPEGAWAELLRHEGITDPEDLKGFRERAIWVV